MIGLKRKERLLKHIKEASDFVKERPELILKEFPKKIWGDSVCCCPIHLFFKNLCIFIEPHQRIGLVHHRKAKKCMMIYDFNDSHWWRKLSPITRKSVIKWLNERIKKGLL